MQHLPVVVGADAICFLMEKSSSDRSVMNQEKKYMVTGHGCLRHCLQKQGPHDSKTLYRSCMDSEAVVRVPGAHIEKVSCFKTKT